MERREGAGRDGWGMERRRWEGTGLLGRGGMERGWMWWGEGKRDGWGGKKRGVEG